MDLSFLATLQHFALSSYQSATDIKTHSLLPDQNSRKVTLWEENSAAVGQNQSNVRFHTIEERLEDNNTPGIIFRKMLGITEV